MKSSCNGNNLSQVAGSILRINTIRHETNQHRLNRVTHPHSLITVFCSLQRFFLCEFEVKKVKNEEEKLFS